MRCYFISQDDGEGLERLQRVADAKQNEMLAEMDFCERGFGGMRKRAFWEAVPVAQRQRSAGSSAGVIAINCRSTKPRHTFRPTLPGFLPV
ncbi:hypothetical protein JKG47_12390 [Acidithiobacillus sp. MC6.1]|nr:hypothetical protein [Acidithiobacillus sp. MC6.1]